MRGMPVAGANNANPRSVVCRIGTQTGVQCGQYVNRLIGTQYLTSGMPESIPGDSGGPAWQINRQKTATIIGIWLGEHLPVTGEHYGRYAGLTDALSQITGQPDPR